MAPTTSTVPADNLAMRTHVIEECVPQLSLADLEAVAQVMNRRYQELKAAQQQRVLEAHYAHLRALPAGTPLQVDRYGDKDLPQGSLVTLKRSLRKPSTNIVVYGRDDTSWTVPMDWLTHETEEEAMRTALRSARDSAAAQRLRER